MKTPAPEIPLFELFVGDDKLAHLHEPKWEEMFWCSYRVVPISEAADQILHDEAIWNEVKFRVRLIDGRFPGPGTFSGEFTGYCRRETDRLSFRSLWPSLAGDFEAGPPTRPAHVPRLVTTGGYWQMKRLLVMLGPSFGVFAITCAVSYLLRSDGYGFPGFQDGIRRMGFPLVMWEEGGFAHRRTFDTIALVVDLAFAFVTGGLMSAPYLKRRRRTFRTTS